MTSDRGLENHRSKTTPSKHNLSPHFVLLFLGRRREFCSFSFFWSRGAEADGFNERNPREKHTQNIFKKSLPRWFASKKINEEDKLVAKKKQNKTKPHPLEKAGGTGFFLSNEIFLLFTGFWLAARIVELFIRRIGPQREESVYRPWLGCSVVASDEIFVSISHKAHGWVLNPKKT